MEYLPIENHGVIGDMHTTALVGLDGRIDFLCFPRFDSPTIFASLLDHRRGGRFQIAPVMPNPRYQQMYLPDTNILLTRFLSDEGIAELSDFMDIDPAGPTRRIVRRIKAVKGRFRCRLVCDPRFDYGRGAHRVERREDGVVFAGPGDPPLTLFLRLPVPYQVQDGAVQAEFAVEGGRPAAFVLEELPPGRQPVSRAEGYPSAAFKRTMSHWRDWLGGCTYTGRWREQVHRSALVLKLLTSRVHGSIVASPTFGLPESIGGVRNWDYRYSWIRDASFVVYALMRLGFTEEAAAFARWIEARCGELNPDGSLQAMYGIDGRHDLEESVLDHLEGYRGSAPVRIGNAAFRQLQLDIYGALLDSIYLYNKYGQEISFSLWQNLVRLVDWVGENWQRADEGIWEVRGERREFLHSRVMSWVAIDRAVRLALKRSFPAPLDRWRQVRDQIYTGVMNDFWDPRLQSFVQYKGARSLDASMLLLPLIKFVGPTDPRWLSTLRAVGRELAMDTLVYRYRDREIDGLAGEEGTFSICSFWYVECLSRAGDLDQARLLFEKALSYSNHLGLYAEELGLRGEHLGNFPQAFTHLGLISAAYNLDRMLNAADPRGAAPAWAYWAPAYPVPGRR